MRQHRHRCKAARMAALAGCLSLLSGVTVVGTVTSALATAKAPAKAPAGATAATKASDKTGCQLGNGVKHVVELTFDNVHFFRDNPNVPSDLQMMPNLLNFFTSNGTFLSNNHTPLIAHTADDLLTTFTGLYGDREGMPIVNSYQVYNPDGTTDPAGSFAYWTDPIYDTAAHPNPGHDTNPSQVYSATPPATTSPAPAPDKSTPAPWVPFTRAGCDVGETGTVNQDLENTSVDIPKVFGANSPEEQQLAADTDSFKDARPPTTWASPCTVRNRTRSAPRPRGSSTARVRPPRPRCPTCCPTSPAAIRASRPCSGTATSLRSSARAPRT